MTETVRTLVIESLNEQKQKFMRDGARKSPDIEKVYLQCSNILRTIEQLVYQGRIVQIEDIEGDYEA